MKYATLVEDFMIRFPELDPLFQEELQFYEGKEMLPHCFLGDVLNCYVTELLRKNTDQQQIQKIFNFYEELASSGDWNVSNLLQVTLLEYLWDEKPVYKNALKYMLPNTRSFNNAIARYLEEPSL